MNRPDANLLAELALAYVAGIVEADERRQVEAWLAAGDPRTGAAVAEAEATLAGLAAASVEPVAPGDGQWRRLAAQLETPEKSTKTAPPPPVIRLPRQPMWPAVWAAAAAAALIAGGLSYLLASRGVADRQRELADSRANVAQQRDQLDAQNLVLQRRQTELADRRGEVNAQQSVLNQQIAELERQREQLRAQNVLIAQQRDRIDAGIAQLDDQERRAAGLAGELEQVRRQLEFVTAPGVLVAQVSGTAEMPGIEGRAFVSASQGRVQLTVSRLTPPAADRTYQFWVIPEGEGQAPVSIGTFAVGGDGAARFETTLPATNAPPKVLAISLEPAGGTESPTGPIVATGPIGG